MDQAYEAGQATGSKHEIAKYKSHGREYKGNPLIEALPRYPSTRARLQNKLDVTPKFGRALLKRSALHRRLRLANLAHWFIADNRVCELADFIHSELLLSYAGRNPYAAGANLVMQQQYLTARNEDVNTTLQRVSALTGIAGAGKTRAVTRIVRRLYPPIIYHPNLNLWQVPVLFIQMPYHGKQGVSLAIAIIEELHSLYPQGEYDRLYLSGGRSEPLIMSAARRLLHVHRVGLLIVDDAQHTGPLPLDNYSGEEFTIPATPRTPVTWMAGLLFDASKTSKAPLLMLATADLEAVLGKLLRTVRLKYGNGLPHWDPLDHDLVAGHFSEFDLFMNRLWACTLLREPPSYDVNFRNAFLYYTAAIPDIIVKLFFVLQWRALQEDRETFVLADIGYCARKYLKSLTRVAIHIRKLAEKNVEAEQALYAMPDLRYEFDIRMTEQGPIRKPPPNPRSEAKDSRKMPPLKPAGHPRRRTAPKQDPADLPRPEHADASAIGAGQ